MLVRHVSAVSQVTCTLWQSPPEGSERVFETESWELAQKISVKKIATCGAWVYANQFLLRGLRWYVVSGIG
jgi:hypothetical protein